MNNLREIDFKNCIFYYFNDIIKVENFDFDNISLDEKSLENILIHEISYKILISAKPLRPSFDKAHGFIRAYNGTRYLVSFGREKYESI